MNFQAIILGPPQMGKSSLSAMLIEEALDHRRWVLAHDPLGQYKGLCKSYKNAAHWRELAKAAAEANTPMPRGAAIGGSAGEVLALARELGQKHNRVDDVRFPMRVVFDESSLIDTSGSTFISPQDNQVIATRRHLGMELQYLVQRRTQLMAAFWDLATDVYLFAQQEDECRALEKLLHLPKGALQGLVGMQPHKFVHVQPGNGIV